MKKIIATLLPITSILSIALLAGCTTTQTTSNANTGITEEVNTNEVTEVSENTNANENTSNSNEAVEVVDDTNTEETNTDEVDTTNWLTYTNEEYGFSFRYPLYIYPNYTSLNEFPVSRVSITDALEERTDENPFLEYTQGEMLAERDEINRAIIDNKTYKKLDGGITAKVILKRVEGGTIIKVYRWYDDQYQYSIKLVFPVDKEMEDDFRSEYGSSDEVEGFMEDVKAGKAPKKFQSIFDDFDFVMSTFQVI